MYVVAWKFTWEVGNQLIYPVSEALAASIIRGMMEVAWTLEMSVNFYQTHKTAILNIKVIC
jgi:hypothetical protein